MNRVRPTTSHGRRDEQGSSDNFPVRRDEQGSSDNFRRGRRDEQDFSAAGKPELRRAYGDGVVREGQRTTGSDDRRPRPTTAELNGKKHLPMSGNNQNKSRSNITTAFEANPKDSVSCGELQGSAAKTSLAQKTADPLRRRA